MPLKVVISFGLVNNGLHTLKDITCVGLGVFSFFIRIL